MQKFWVWVCLLALLVIVPDVRHSHAQETDTLLSEIGGVQVDDKPLDAVAISPDGRLGASGGRDNLIRVWDMAENDSLPAATLLLEAHEARITDLAFSPDGTLLASTSADLTLRVWDVSSGALLYTIDDFTDAVMSVTFSADGRLLAAGGRDTSIWLGDPLTGETLLIVDNVDQPVWALAFSPDSTVLASASEDGSIWLWGMGDDPSLRQLTGHIGPVMSLTFSDDGETLISGGMDGQIRVWSLASDDEPPVLHGHIAPVTRVDFTEDGRLVSVGLDGTVRLWDVDAGEQIEFVTRNNLPLTSMAIYGSTVAIVGTEGMLTLWNVAEPPAPVVVQNPPPRQVAQVNDAPREDAVQVNNAPPQDDPPETSTTQTQTNQSPLPDNGTYISIPVAGITSAITSFPLDGTSWAIDPWESNVGYLQGTAWLNENGNTVLGGHSQYPNGNAGIFRNLYDVSVGDVIVVREDGADRQYVVVEIRTVYYTDLTVLYPTTHSRLTLITCDVPSFDAVSNVYYDRLVVIADRVG
ncbi:MAG: sortase [Aggregatilineales bacterium]